MSFHGRSRRRGPAGESWWSRRFLDVLEGFQLTSRLLRGRRYARGGRVLTLSVKPGLVTAEVQGSRRHPYRVRIGVAKLSNRDWARAEKELAGQALYLARLLSGEMPHEIEEAFTTCRLSLFPSRPSDLDTGCTCLDWVRPCKHVAAAFYVLADRFDEDPFLLFAWRGRTREELLARLRELRALPEKNVKGRTPKTGTQEGQTLLGGAVTDFYQAAGGASEPLALHPHRAADPGAIVRELGPRPPGLKGPELGRWLLEAYERMTRGAESLAYGKVRPGS